MAEETPVNSIEVNNLNFSYGSSYDQVGKHVLKGLNMQLAPGARYEITIRGCGRTNVE